MLLIISILFLFLDDHFLGNSAFLTSRDDEIDAVDSVLHLVGVGVGVHGIEGLEVVE